MNTGSNIAKIELHYLPSLAYMGLFTVFDKINPDSNDIFYKQTFRNRTIILSANKPLSLIIPVKKGKTAQESAKVRIDYNSNWKHIHRQSIISSYSNSPYFKHYSEEILSHYMYNEEFLNDFNLKLLKTLLLLLGLENKLIINENTEADNELLDFRNRIRPKTGNSIYPVKIKDVPYYQVFNDRHGFVPGLSIIDLLFNEGPETLQILRKMFEDFNPDKI